MRPLIHTCCTEKGFYGFFVAADFRCVSLLDFFTVLFGGVASAQVTRLTFRHIDAAYSKSLDRAIFISASPNQLHIYNVAAQSDVMIDLPAAPLNMSLSYDGNFAAVAFASSVEQVGLQTATVAKTFPNVNVGSGKVIHGGSSIYVVPLS